MLRLAFDFIITWRETRTRPNAYQKTSTPGCVNDDISIIGIHSYIMLFHCF